MTDSEWQRLGLLGKLVLALALLLSVAGVFWHGVTVSNVQRIWDNMVVRPSGPKSFRFILQPSMAAIIGIRQGLKDARRGRSPYLWTLLSQPEKRIGRLREGLNATARIILLGIAMDGVYQIIVLKQFFPIEALIVALLLAFIPYLVIRGVAARIAGLWQGRTSGRRLSQ